MTRHARPTGRRQCRAYRAAVVAVRPRHRRRDRRGDRLRHRRHGRPARRGARGLAVRHRVRPRVLGEVPRLRRTLGAGPRAARPATARSPEELHEELATTGQRASVGASSVVGLIGTAFVSMLVGFVGPIGSLGPKPRGERAAPAGRLGPASSPRTGRRSSWTRTTFDQLVTVFPEDHIGEDDSQVVLLRMPPEALSERTVERGALEGWVAYSKICTHAGCSVGAVRRRQPRARRAAPARAGRATSRSSIPTDGARPVGGPATRSLPQLALAVDENGFLVAAGPGSTASSDRSPGTKHERRWEAPRLRPRRALRRRRHRTASVRRR